MTSLIIVIFLGKFYDNNIYKNILSAFLGIFLSTLIKIPLNYFAWLYFFGIPKESVDSLVFTIIIPFNIIKNLINCIIALSITNILKRKHPLFNNFYNKFKL